MAFTNILEDLAPYLVSAGLGLIISTNLFGGVLPDKPDAAVALFEYTPDPSIETMGNRSRPAIERPSLQVMVRDPIYDVGRSLADGIWTTLRVVANQTINDQHYVAITSAQSPFHAHSDNSRRHYFSCNYTVDRSL